MFDLVIPSDAKPAIQRSRDRYLRAIDGVDAEGGPS
jgi:hypothetical protein